MDFAWVVDALRRGLKVTREAWRVDPSMYLYMVTEKKPDGKRIIKMHTGAGQDFEWSPTAEQMLIVDDWEEYVEPKALQEGPFVINPLSLTGTMGLHGGQAVEDQSDYAKEVRKAVADEEHQKELLDTLVNTFAELVSQRVAQLLQAKKEPDHV